MDFNKDLIAASSTPMVLAILAEEDSYGYAILQRVRELSGGHLEWTDGMLYPVLHRLERLGYIKARWEIADSGRRRKYYGITSEGRKQLAEEREQWQAVDAALRKIWRGVFFSVVRMIASPSPRPSPRPSPNLPPFAARIAPSSDRRTPRNCVAAWLVRFHSGGDVLSNFPSPRRSGERVRVRGVSLVTT